MAAVTDPKEKRNSAEILTADDETHHTCDGFPATSKADFRSDGWRDQVDAAVRRRATRRESRQQFAEARRHGLNARHASKLNRTREDATMPTKTAVAGQPDDNPTGYITFSGDISPDLAEAVRSGVSAIAERRLICRYLRPGVAGQCTAESLFGEDSDVLLCERHAGIVLEQIQFRLSQMGETR